jgi:hypothetical protein
MPCERRSFQEFQLNGSDRDPARLVRGISYNLGMTHEEIRQKYRREHIDLLKSEIADLTKEGADQDDMAFNEAKLYLERALEFLGRDDLRADCSFRYALAYLEIVRRDLKSKKELHAALEDLFANEFPSAYA